jgi:hypothetical protein
MSPFWSERFQAHFQKHFQKPFDIQIYHDRDDFSLKLAIHDRANPAPWFPEGSKAAGTGYRVYASLGLADMLVNEDEDDFGEVILFSDVPDREVPQLFINALFFILLNDIPLGSRFAIGGITEMRAEFARRYKKSALYFTLANSKNEAFNRVRRGEDFSRVYQAFFISAEEDRYLEDNGPGEFEKKMQDQEGDPLSLLRPSCV